MALLLLGLLQNLPAQAARLALVIGNDAYRQIEPLKNARNDARLMAATLKEAGFEVERVHENLDRKDMLRAINGFKARVTKADEVVFFYAGHGIQIGRQSPVLLPVDITQENDDQIVQDGVQLSTVQDALTGAGFALLVIDACREDPFPRKSDGTRGMARQTGLELSQPPKGSMVLMSAGKGEKALDYVPDGTRGNGLFTHEFVQAIKTPGRPLLMAISEVKARVPAKAQRAGNNQNPAYADDSTGGSFVFFAGQLPVVALSVIAPALQLASEQEVEQKLWNFIEASSDVQDFQDYLKRYPNGRFAPLAQRQLRVLTARQQPLPPVQAPVLASVSAPVPAPTQSSAVDPISGALGKRVALLIGNAKYQQMPLKFPVSDVRLIGSELQSLGFTTQIVTDADRKTMVRAIDDFGKQAETAAIAMIYYAGHGAQVMGRNYLIPVGFNIQAERDLDFEAVQLDRMMESFERVQKLGILVVDAGRESPFYRGTRGGGPRGLERIEPPSKTIVVLTTKPGSTSGEADGGTYSPFARHLAFYLKQPELEIGEVFSKTGEAVRIETRGMQEPWSIGPTSNGIYLAKHLSVGPAR
jgi:uncharacterized caspase-like protein